MSPYEYIFDDQFEIFPHENKIGVALLMLLAALLLAGCFQDDPSRPWTNSAAAALLSDCKRKGGVLVTNTRPARGEPQQVCVKPL